jgi:hypothetical protein
MRHLGNLLDQDPMMTTESHVLKVMAKEKGGQGKATLKELAKAKANFEVLAGYLLTFRVAKQLLHQDRTFVSAIIFKVAQEPLQEGHARRESMFVASAKVLTTTSRLARTRASDSLS